MAAIGEGTFIWAHAQVRERVRIGRECVVGKGVYVDCDVIVGDRCKLENGVSVFSPATLASGVFLGPGVVLTNDRLPRAVFPDGEQKGPRDWQALPVRVATGAAIGAASVVLAGVSIGRWALVGAGAVVLTDVPDHGLVVGNPARLVGFVCRCGAGVTEDALQCRECIARYGACEAW